MAKHFMNPSMGKHMGEDPAPAAPAAPPAPQDDAPFDIDAMSQAIAQAVRDFLSQNSPQPDNDQDDYGLGS